MKQIIFPVVLAVICLTGTVKAQEATTNLTLKSALDYALVKSVDIQKAMLDQEKADYQVSEIKGRALPQLDGNGQLQYFPNLPTQLLPGEIIGQEGTQIPVQFGTKYNMQGGFELSQVLFDQGLFTGLSAAKTSEEFYQLLKTRSDEDVIYQVSAAFYQVLEIQAQMNALESNLEELQKLQEILEVQYDNDIVTRTDLNRIKVNRTNLETQLQSLITSEQQSKNYLKVLMGMSIAEPIALIPPEDLEETNLQLLSLEKSDPIQLRILDKQQELNMLNEQNIQAGYYPTLVAFGQQQWQAQRNEFNFFDNDELWFEQTVVGVRLAVPIFDGFQKRRRVQQNMIEIEKTRLDIENTQRNLDMTYTNAREELVNTLKSVNAQRENQELAKEVYDQTRELYQEGVSTLTDFLDAETSLRQAEVNYRRQILKFKVAELDLMKAQGQLTQILQN